MNYKPFLAFSYFLFLEIQSLASVETLEIPARCFLKSEIFPDKCLSCSIDFYSESESDTLDFPFNESTCLEKQKDKLNLSIFVSSFQEGVYMDGSLNSPFKNLLLALEFAHNKAKLYKISEIAIYLLGRSHVVSRKMVEESGVKHFFRRQMTFISILPAFCEDWSEGLINKSACLSMASNETVTINVASSLFIFITVSFRLVNLIFDGRDINLCYKYLVNQCLEQTEGEYCCKENELMNPYSDYFAGGPSLSIQLIENLKGGNFTAFWGFFNVDFIEPGIDSIPNTTILIRNCDFINFAVPEPQNSGQGYSTSLIMLLKEVNTNLILENLLIRTSYWLQGIIYTKNRFLIPSQGQNQDTQTKITITNMHINNYYYLLNTSLISKPGFLIYLNNFSVNLTIANFGFKDFSSQYDNLTVLYVASESLLVMDLWNFLVLNTTSHTGIMAVSKDKGDIKIFGLLIKDAFIKSAKRAYLKTVSANVSLNNTLISNTNYPNYSNLSYSDFFSFEGAAGGVLIIFDLIKDKVTNVGIEIQNMKTDVQSLRMINCSSSSNLFSLINSDFSLANLLSLSHNCFCNNIIEIKNFPKQNVQKGKLIYLANITILDLFMSKIVSFSSFLLISGTGDKDLFSLNDFNIQNIKTVNRNQDFSIFSCFSFNALTAKNIYIANMNRGPVLFIVCYDFHMLRIDNLSFKNVYRNTGYFIAISCKSCDFFLKNLTVDNAALDFDSFYFDVTHGRYTDFNFTNIYAITRQVWYVFNILNHENCLIENFNFMSSNFSYLIPRVISNPYGTILIYSEKNINFTIDKGYCHIDKNNDLMMETYLLGSYMSQNLSITNITSFNFNCLRNFNGNLLYENGIIAFVSSKTYFPGAEVLTSIFIMNVTIEKCSFCQRGVLGIVNAADVFIKNLVVMNTESNSGGVISIVSTKKSNIQNVTSHNSHVSGEGGFACFINSVSIIIMNSSISATSAILGGAFYLKNVQEFKLENTIVLNSTSKSQGGAISALSSNLTVSNVLFSYVSSLLEGGVFYLKLASLKISKNSTSINSWASVGGFAFFEDCKQIVVDSVSIHFSNANEKGGSFFVSETLYLDINFLTLAHIDSLSGNFNIESMISGEYIFKTIKIIDAFALGGSFLDLNSGGSLSIYNVTGFALAGPFLSLKSFNYTEMTALFDNVSIIGQIKIHEEEFPESLISMEGVNIKIASMIISDMAFRDVGFEILNSIINIEKLNFSVNTSFKYNDPILFSVYESFLTLDYIYFQGLNEQNLGFLLVSDSELLFTNVTILKCQTQEDSCIGIYSSNLKVENSKFEECKGAFVGVFSITESSIIFRNNIFSSNNYNNRYFLEHQPEILAANLHFYDCELVEIDWCEFIEASFGNQIVSLSTKLSLNNSKLHAKNEAFINVKAVFGINSNVNISYSDFKSFHSEKGGALTFENSGPELLNLLMFQVSFNSCVSDSGGVFYIKGLYEVFISYCEFSYNIAAKFNRKSLGSAGVGLFDGYISDILISKINIMNNDFFINKADSMAPTIFSNIKINEYLHDEAIKSNKFYKNVDGLKFTSNLSGFPLNFAFTFENKKINLTENIEMVSGKPFTLKVEVTDAFGQVFKNDNSSRAYIEPSRTSNISALFKGFQKWTKSQAGIFAFDLLAINADPGTVFELNISFIFNQGSYGLKETFDSSRVLKFYSRPCVKGEIFLPNSKICYKCPEGKYSIEDPYYKKNEDSSCKLCPNNAYCPGGDIILLQQGYWRASYFSNTIQPCMAKKACLGSISYNISEEEGSVPVDVIHGTCLKNNYGPFCFLCEKNSARFDETEICFPCEINFLSYLKLVFLVVVFAMYLLFQVTLTMRSSKRSNASPLLKLLINHFQLFGMISLAGIGLSSDIDGVLKTQEFFLFMAQYNFPIECFVSDVDYNVFSLKVIIATITPLLFFLATLLVWILLLLITRGSNKKKFLDQMVLTLFLIISLLFPQIIRTCSSLLRCISLDNESSELNVLFYSPDVACWEEEHINFILAALPGFLCWGVFFPFYLSAQLYRKRTWIKRIIKITKPRVYTDKDLKKGYNYLEKLRKGMIGKNDCISLKRDRASRRRNFIFPMPLSSDNQESLFTNIVALFEAEEKKDFLRMENNIYLEAEIKDKDDSTKPIFSLRRRSLLDLNNVYNDRMKSIDLNLRRGLILKYLYLGYSSKYFYWEMIIYAKKFLLILIGNLKAVLPPGMPKILLIILLGIFMISQIRKRPFITSYLNKIQFFSSLTIFLTVFMGIIGSNILLKDLNTMFLIFVTTTNAMFLLYWFRNFWIFSLRHFTFVKYCLKQKWRKPNREKGSRFGNKSFSEFSPTEEHNLIANL